MKTASVKPSLLSSLLFTLAAIALFTTSCKKIPDHIPTLHINTVATGLVAPIGLETDRKGNVWICETGTASNDGKVVVVTPSGEKFDAIINMSSIFNAKSGEPEGPAHLVYEKGMLYILSANYLYTVDVTNFTPGDAPLDATKLPYEDIGSFVMSYPFVNDYNDTHPYNLTKGPDGDFYITDAGANAIIHRKGKGQYSILAEIPGIPNPTTMGGPQVESVPTGILFDGQDFLVTTLLGFPFPSGYARIYRVSTSGNVSLYQEGFTSLVDIAKGNYFGQLVLQHAEFGPKGFLMNTGALVWANGTNMKVLADKLNMPVGIKQINPAAWYITTLGDGTLLKASYY